MSRESFGFRIVMMTGMLFAVFSEAALGADLLSQSAVMSGGAISATAAGAALNPAGDPAPSKSSEPTAIVPNVVGQSSSQAAGFMLLSASLSLGAVTQQCSDAEEPGTVLSQNPAAGTELPIDSSVDLVVSSGPCNVTVPDVTGQTQAAAGSMLTDAYLSAGAVTQACSDTVNQDMVASQDPAAGTVVPADTSVSLVVSSGPCTATVPDLAGKTQAEAGNLLTVAHLATGAVTQACSDTVAAGSVVSQNPAAGAKVDLDSAVALVVSSGPCHITVPDVVGQKLSDALTLLTNANLNVSGNNINQECSETVEKGLIIRQDPAAGAQAAPGSDVVLFESSGSCYTTVPDVTGKTQAEADALFIGAGLSTGAVTQGCSETVAAGLVISENPAAGTKVLLGSAVALVVRINQACYPVPDVVGKTQDEANQNLGSALFFGSFTQACSGTVAAGLVVSQDPAAGVLTPVNSSVEVVVSSGPCQPVTVPNVTGETQTAAGALLGSAGFTVGTVTQQCSDTVAAGLVVSQTPIAGAQLSPGSAVMLVVSTGPCNDTCDTAVTLLLNTPYNGSNVGAATDLAADDGSGADVWFQLTAPSAGNYEFSLCDSSFDTTLYVYSGSCASLAQVGYNDNSCGLQSLAVVYLTADSTCFLRVAGKAGATGNYTLLSTILPGFCPGNVVADGGFEEGSPSTAWQEYSLNNGTPLAEVGSHYSYEGNWVCLFGGNGPVEDGSISQEITLPADSAQLSFYLWIFSAGTPGYMKVLVDNQQLFEATEADAAAYADWTRVEVDLSAFADGKGHTLKFSSHTDEVSSDPLLFVLDAVCVQSLASLVPVPGVTGQTQTDAQTALIGAGLTVGVVTPVCGDTGVPTGTIIGQSPVAGARVQAGTVVALQVAAGSCVPVPDVTSMSQGDAEAALTAVNLTVGEITEECGSSWPQGTVISQSPGQSPMGSGVPAGSAVALTVSSGPCPVLMPYVEGMTLEEAKSALEGGEMAVGTITQVCSDATAAGRVISQDPAAGGQFIPGTPVALVVASGRCTVLTNDTCDTAATLLLNTPYAGSNVDAATDLVTGDGSEADVWFRFDAAAAGNYEFSLFGSAFDTTLYVYSGSCGSLVQIGYNDNTNYVQSAVLVYLTAGSTCFLRVAGNSGAAGTYTLLATLLPGFCPGNMLVDGGFEEGTPSTAWQETSVNYGSPLREMPDSAYEGDWLCVFGGDANEEDSSVTQEFYLPSDATSLSFYLRIPESGTTGHLRLLMDNQQIFEATSADAAKYAAWTRVEIDLSTYCDGGMHVFVFSSHTDQAASAPLRFFVDDMCVHSVTSMTTVPEVTGQTQTDASTAVTDYGLALGTITQMCSNTVAPGLVISQIPAANAFVPSGSAVALVVSAEDCVAVPDVTGQTQGDAAAAITGANLAVGTVTQACSDTAATGLVISQNPAADAQAPPGSAVALVVSTGPCPVTVPNVAGETESVADTLLANAGLAKGAVTQQCSNTVAAGLVISQDPAAGEQLVRSSAVALVVSTGACSTAVANDTCGTAATLLLNTPYSGSNAGAATDLVTNDDSGADVWFRFDAVDSHYYEFALCGSSFDTTLYAYSGICGSLAQIGYDDNFCAPQSLALVYLEAGSTCFLRVAGHAGATGDYTLLATILPGYCPGNALADGGFEKGSPNTAWKEYSLNYGTPLYETGPGSAYEGSWVCFFGGDDAEEDGSVWQDLVLPVGVDTLAFYLWIVESGTPGYMKVLVDGQQIFEATEADAAGYAAWTRVAINISAFADGGTHSVQFYSHTDEVSSAPLHFYLDGVCIQSAASMVLVPDVVGQTNVDGTATLIDANLVVGVVAPVCSATVAAGLVMSQNPAAGTLVSAGTIVALDMSAGVCQTVPDVTGQTQADASTAIEDANMTVGEVTRQCSDTVAAGLVISQNPAGDEQAPLGSAVSLVLSSGSCLFLVPDVAGQTRDEAEMAIMGVGLNLGVVTEGCSDTVAEGLVMSQDPPAGTSVPPGDTVALVLSAGSCSVSVPDVAGMPQADAAEAFAEASLTVGAITQVCSSTVAAGLVISQDPSAGATADFGSAVALVVSTGGCGGAANDTCGTAAILLLDAPYSNSTAGAATDLVTADGSGADVWFTFEAATTAKYRFSLCGSSFDTTLYVYEGDCNSPVQVGYNNDASCGAQSQVDLSLSGGTVYFLRVAGHAGETGDYTLRASIPPPVDYCPGNVLADGGFESGAANGAWQMQSLNRESPLCTNFPEFAQEGHVFVLFGASQAAEDGSVTQEVTLPAGSAKISFYVWMPVAGSTGYMRLLVDGQKLFEATEADASLFSNWARIEVDISAFADGGQHAVAFVSHTDAMDALLDFALDSVCVQAFGVAPDVVGQTLTEANTAIHTANLTTGAVTQQCSDTVAAGLVISQDPAAGTSAAPGSAVALVISTGSCPVTLPNVVGETQIAAGTLLTDAHLSAGTVTQQCSGTVEAGLIISQDPAAGTSAAPGSAVALVVSTGPCPVTVPNLADETQEAAGILLTGANLTTGVVTQECSNTVAAGSVISQNPAAATQTAPGSAVALVVSTGPCPVTVPYVAGETREAAGILLTGAQLTTGIVTQQCSNSVTAGLVISQDPAAATQAAPGSAVALVISTGSCPVTVPDLMGLVRLAALSLLTGANLTAGTMMQECSSTVTAGLIMRQDPAAGTQAVPGSAVSFVVSTGPCVTVPNVVGQGQTTAGGMLSAAGLATGTLTQQCSDTVDKGLVLSQTPPANAQVSSGSAVALVISTGPCPVTVPNVVGQTEAAAGNVLSAVFLTIGTITRQNSATVPEGAIISQDPAAGTQAVPGGSVSLVVSLGPGDVMVPDVTGMTQEAAGTALQGAHLTAGTVTQQCSDTVAEGKIISQNPVPTTQASRGSSVALVVSTGPCPVSYVSVPDLAGLAVTEAQTALNDAHLIPGDVTQHCSNTVAQGAVISQNPPAGTMVTSGGPVNLVLSAGACPPVPPTVEDLRGRLTSSFALMDTNGDGKISFEEALALLPGLTQAVFDEVNTSGTGQITRTEAGLDTTGCAGCSGGKSAFTHGQMLELLGNLFVGGLGLMVLSVFAKRRL